MGKEIVQPGPDYTHPFLDPIRPKITVSGVLLGCLAMYLIYGTYAQGRLELLREQILKQRLQIAELQQQARVV